MCRLANYKIPAYHVMILSKGRVESRGRDFERRSENAERDGGWIEVGVGGRVGVAHLEGGQLEVVCKVVCSV